VNKQTYADAKQAKRQTLSWLRAERDFWKNERTAGRVAPYRVPNRTMRRAK
jgi:hypothetical protein